MMVEAVQFSIYVNSGNPAYYNVAFDDIPISFHNLTVNNNVLGILNVGSIIPFGVKYSTVPFTFVGNTLLSFKNTAGSYSDIRPAGNAFGNVFQIDLIINTQWSNDTVHASLGTDDLAFEESGLYFYNLSGKSYYVFPEMEVTKINATNAIYDANNSTSNAPVLAQLYFLTLRYVLPAEAIKDKCYYLYDIPLVYLYDYTAYYGWYNVSFSGNYLMSNSESMSVAVYQANMILEFLAQMQNIMLNPNQDGANSIGQALNNNAQTIAQQILQSGNNTVNVINQQTNQILNFDMGQIAKDTVKQIADNKEYLNEQATEFEKEFDKVLDDFAKMTIEAIANSPVYQDIFTPIYEMVVSFPLIPMMLILFLAFIVIVIIFRR